MMTREMLEISPDRFVYSGQRSVRGIMADVWTGQIFYDDDDVDDDHGGGGDDHGGDDGCGGGDVEKEAKYTVQWTAFKCL